MSFSDIFGGPRGHSQYRHKPSRARKRLDEIKARKSDTAFVDGFLEGLKESELPKGCRRAYVSCGDTIHRVIISSRVNRWEWIEIVMLEGLKAVSTSGVVIFIPPSKITEIRL